MSQKAQMVTLAVHGVILVALLAVVAALGWHGSIGEQATVAILSGVLGLVGGSAGTLAVQGFTNPPPNTVQVQAATADPPPPVAS